MNRSAVRSPGRPRSAETERAILDAAIDLLAMLQGAQRAMAGGDGPVMCAFVSEKARHPELHGEYQRAFVAERRAHVQALIAAAVKRGELPPSTDVELFAEFGPAVLAHRLMVGGTEPDVDLPRRIVDQLLGPSS